MTTEEQIKRLEKEIRETPYHKATEHHIGKLRARIKKLRCQLMSGGKRKGGGKGGFAIKKQGDATVALLGFPSVGKSTLLTKLTNARSKIAPYSFTTITVVPGMLVYNGAYIQMLDLPGVICGAAKGKGRGREVLSVVRVADLIIFVDEYGKKSRFNSIEDDLRLVGVVVDQTDHDADLYKNTPALYVMNKTDLSGKTDIEPSDPNRLSISAEKEQGLHELKEAIWKKLELKRIYLKKKAGKVDKINPLIVNRHATIHDIAKEISAEMAEEVVGGKIWEGSAKFPCQEVGLAYIPSDETIVQLIR